MSKWAIRAAMGLLVLTAPVTAFAYDEAVDGDLSSDPAAPKLVTLSLGTNPFIGRVTNAGLADARDYLTFTIPAGRRLSGLRLLSYTDVPGGGAGNTGFHAINAGATSFIPSSTTDNNFLGGDHVVSVPSGTDLLPELVDGDTAGVGTTAPLGPGTYSYVIQQTGNETSAYHLEFVVTAAPAVPASDLRAQVILLVLLLALGGLLAARRKRALV